MAADKPTIKLNFAPISAAVRDCLVVFCNDRLALGPVSAGMLKPAGDLLARAAKASKFTGKVATSLDIVVPEGLGLTRLVVIGTGPEAKLSIKDTLKIGGLAKGLIRGVQQATIVAEHAGGPMSAEQAATIALGVTLRSYEFKRYKTKRKDDEEPANRTAITMAVADPNAARKSFGPNNGIADGIMIARDLVNEPANVLYPEEFARRASRLRGQGVKVEVLDVKAMSKLGMGALLGVGQGSVRPSRVVVMQWNGGRKGGKPVAFVGKGVCFDTGGISIKPAAGMEDMKGDMAGAACVVGLMHALAARRARVNAVGIIGLVENMPDGNAIRPGDILTSMSGQTIEVINTDAEGRLVLADCLWYTAKRFKPQFMVDLATLTGAIIVALGQEFAGMFSNNDALAERLTQSGVETGETVWRMPLAPEYDKMIDSKFADVKNTGGSRWAGAITAAQFLQRFIADETPWAHLDIAGTGFDSRQSETNRSWGSGWGVRLLDHLVAEHYEEQR